MSELMNIIKSRRSTRAFKPELPPVEQIRRIVEAAEWAPSGMGRYNWHFSVVYNPEKTLKLARAIAEADNAAPSTISTARRSSSTSPASATTVTPCSTARPLSKI